MITSKEMFQIIPQQKSLEEEIAGAYIDSRNVTGEEVVINGFYMLIIESGTMTISINGGEPLMIGERDLVFLFRDTVVKFISCDDKFSAKHIILGNQFVYKLSLPRKLFPEGFFHKLYGNPVSRLGPRNMSLLSMRVEAIIAAINGVSHLFHREMVLCSVAMMLLDISNITPRDSHNRKDMSGSRKDEIMIEFVKLLDEYGKKKRGIPFYADKLCITPQYLSRLVRHCTTKTVYFHICHALMSEAKHLLRNKYGTIQQVSEKMNFSDQAAFGKFFKKHEGMSPIEYRKKW